jgi:hypothetical protein
LGVGAAALAGVISLGAGAASAAPSNAKNSTTGTFSACSDGSSGTFVINTGNANGMSWGQAHLTLANGSTANFKPSSLNITFTFTPTGQPPQSQTQMQTKNNPKGSVTCTIHAGGSSPEGTFALDGTVVGTITTHG